MRIKVLRLQLVLVGIVLSGSQAAAQEAPRSRTIRVAFFDVGSKTTVARDNMQRCLDTPAEAFTMEVLKAEDIRSGALAKFDVLLIPGGSGSGQAKNLEEAGCKAIVEFVRGGGGYVGFCAGAYLASSHYSWSLNLLNAKVLDTAHWARGTGDVKLRLNETGKKVLGVSEDLVTCYYGQGPLLAPGNNTALEPMTVLATYETEIAKKGAPTGVMKGTAAAATGTFGKGKVFCFSPHPEKTAGLEDLVRRAVRWAAPAGASE